MEREAPLPRIEPRHFVAELEGAGPVEVAEVRLTGIPRGAVALLCGGDGLATQAPEVMNALAEHGYETLAVDLGSGSLARADAVAAVRSLLALLGERGWGAEQVGVVGYGAGGTAAFAAAGALSLGAAISLSPRDVLAEPVALTSTPWLGMFGEHDEHTTPESVVELGRRLADAPCFSRVVIYPGVGADYFRGAADALGHAAAFDSWQRLVEWLNARVSPRLSPYAELWELRRDPSDPSPEGSVR
ncbi:dienelactone hydrolase family protein [Nocardioides sp.]|uniref:dienelactone hydrolase family protein n=1 Tax=Nocardioides sp. TaxID=35761 RepID=UPI00261E2CF4|nr:dienelactone hydrolase family protein [Nocardioides sp.]